MITTVGELGIGYVYGMGLAQFELRWFHERDRGSAAASSRWRVGAALA